MQLKILLALRILMPKILRAEETAQAELNIESPMTEVTEVLEETNVISPYFYPGIFAALAVLFYFISEPMTKILLRFHIPKLWRDRTPQAVNLREKIVRLISYFLVASFALLSIGTLPFLDRTKIVFLIGEKIIFTVYALGLLYCVFQVIRAAISRQVELSKTRQRRLRRNLVSYLGSLSVGVFWVFAIILVLSIWISNLSTLIAGLGIGGLAIALAAQDSLSNIFGSISIMIDHPFEIGDWITTVDFSGTVEHIGLRSTKIRSGDDALIYVPNRTLANAIITNEARRRTRRSMQTLNFKLNSDLTALQTWATDVSSKLDSWEGVIPGSSLAYYEGLTKEAHVMKLRFLTTTDYDNMLATNERVLFNALELATGYGLELARPLLPDNKM